MATKPATQIRRLRNEVFDLECAKSDLERGNANLVASLNASSEHLKRMVELCDKQRADIAAQRAEITELKTAANAALKSVIKVLVALVPNGEG